MLLYQSGVLPYQSGILPYQSGILPYQSGVLPYQSGLLFYQAGMLHYQSAVYIYLIMYLKILYFMYYDLELDLLTPSKQVVSTNMDFLSTFKIDFDILRAIFKASFCPHVRLVIMKTYMHWHVNDIIDNGEHGESGSGSGK